MAWKVALKLHPIEPLNILLPVGFDERVQFAIRDAVEHPSVYAHISHRLR
jgi:hypothetical protein